MTTRTRYFVIVSLLVLGVGLGTGLVAYYVGFPAGALGRQGGPDELRYVPRDATLVAFANVHDVMTSELRQKLRSVHARSGKRPARVREPDRHQHRNRHRPRRRLPVSRSGQRRPQGAGMVLARGRFDDVKIEALMREHGAQRRGLQRQAARRRRPRVAPDATPTRPTPRRDATPHSFAVAFMEPGLVAVGSTSLIRSAIDLHQAGNNPQTGVESVTGNEELMNLVRSLDDGNAWAVGRFDALGSHAQPPGGRRQPDARHHLVLGQRPRQRRHPRRRARRSARRRGGEQPARRRARLPGAREAADRVASRSCS